MVDWLHRNVEGFTDRREARKYAGNLLKAGYIRHTVSKVTFSEQCYYVFGDLCAGENCPHSPALANQSRGDWVAPCLIERMWIVVNDQPKICFSRSASGQ